MAYDNDISVTHFWEMLIKTFLCKGKSKRPTVVGRLRGVYFFFLLKSMATNLSRLMC